MQSHHRDFAVFIIGKGRLLKGEQSLGEIKAHGFFEKLWAVQYYGNIRCVGEMELQDIQLIDIYQTLIIGKKPYYK